MNESDPLQTVTANDISPELKKPLDSPPSSPAQQPSRLRKLLIIILALGAFALVRVYVYPFIERVSEIASQDLESSKREVELELDAYLRALANKQVEQAYAHFATMAQVPGIRSNLVEMTNGAVVDGYQAMALEEVSFTFGRSRQFQSSVVQVSGSLQYAGGHTGTLQATLVKEGGRWRIWNVNITLPPE